MSIVEIVRKGVHYLSIRTELESFETIHHEIRKGIVFKGTNLWILVFAIVVASIGLNMNSTAVIIGAMLISPLMGPINGIGYSIATYNIDLLKGSLKNFSFAVGISLVASTAYFVLTPISTAHSEILARTFPTIYDVIIAVFGGLAGIVAISSKQKGNVIPGVAIATALMPPLCTAGYGLATLQFNFFYGAFYLFTINTVFIAIASMVISQILKFPIITIVDPVRKRRINRIIYFIIAMVSIPSIYLGNKLIQKEKFTENANRYISNISSFEGNYLLKNEINPKTKSIVLTYAGKSLTDRQKETILQKAIDFNLSETDILINQGLILEDLDTKDREVLKLREELYLLGDQLKLKQTQLDSLSLIPLKGNLLLNEIRNFYPQISGCIYAETINYQDTASVSDGVSLIIFTITGKLNSAERDKIFNWTEERLHGKQIKVIYEPAI